MEIVPTLTNAIFSKKRDRLLDLFHGKSHYRKKGKMSAAILRYLFDLSDPFTFGKQFLHKGISDDYIIKKIQESGYPLSEGPLTPLQAICSEKYSAFHFNCIKILIQNGAEIDPKNNNPTPLAFAALRRNYQAFVYLLSKGANFDLAIKRQGILLSRPSHHHVTLKNMFHQYQIIVNDYRWIWFKLWNLKKMGRAVVVVDRESDLSLVVASLFSVVPYDIFCKIVLQLPLPFKKLKRL